MENRKTFFSLLVWYRVRINHDVFVRHVEYLGYKFCPGPFGKVIDYHGDEINLYLFLWEGANYIYPPLCKWLRVGD